MKIHFVFNPFSGASLAVVAALAFQSAAMAPLPALAAGDNFGGKDCEEGQVYDSETEECADETASSDHTVDDIYHTALAWSAKDEHAKALEILWLADGREDVRILNLLGYSNRMLGRLEIGLVYYRQAIDLDPSYTLVRQYYGEGLLQKGDLSGAKAQLAALGKLCGGPGEKCAAFDDLEAAIAAYEYGA